MKILLIHCAFPPHTWETCLPLGVASLSSYIRSKMVDVVVQVLDANAYGLSEEDVLKHVRKFQPHVLGLSFMTSQADYAYKLTALVKNDSNCDSVRIVHGGVHPTIMFTEALRHGADICVLGEGEETFYEILSNLNGNRKIETISGIAFTQNGKMVCTQERGLIARLDSIPFPYWKEFPLDQYTQSLHLESGVALPLMGSRGCPHSCSFCFSPIMWQHKIRFVDPKKVVGAMEEGMRTTGIFRFHFYDDDLMCRVDWMEELCCYLVSAPVKFRWICLARVDSLCRNRHLLDLMKEAGCVGIEIGVDSTDYHVLKNMGKKITGSQIREAIKLLRKAAISIAVLEIMTCNPNETLESHYHMSKDLREATGLDHVFMGHFATPYPGTRFYREAKEKGMLLCDRWSDYHTERVIFVPNSLLQQKPKRVKQQLSPFDKLLTTVYCRSQQDHLSRTGQLKVIKRLFETFADIDGSEQISFIAERFAEQVSGYLGRMDAIGTLVRSFLVWAQIGAVTSNYMDVAKYESWTEDERFVNPSEWYQENKNNLYRHSVNWK